MGFFAARQPILDKNKELFGYELLFRTSLDNVFPDVDQEKATSKMIEGLQLDLGLDRLADGKMAFINFTQQTLLGGYPELLPKEKVVVEILETARPTKGLYKVFQRLHQKGYVLALDDFVHDDRWTPFYEYVEIVKIDYLESSAEEVHRTIAAVKKFPKIKLLAEKVETNQQFEEALELGFDYFQGYFFSRPEVMKSLSLTPGQASIASLMNKLSVEDPDFSQIAQLFELDVTLSFKLLRYTQSAMFKRRNPIKTIKQAVLVLGKYELQRFVGLLFAAQFIGDKPQELIRLSMQRAKFCELLAPHCMQRNSSSSAFLTGMLSLVDAMLDANLVTVINDLPLSSEIKLALTENKGWLADCITLCQHFEKGNWQEMEDNCKRLNISYTQILEEYEIAGVWAEEKMLELL
ncbi:MAG: EAL and modified HD-GYP domain-containing signal transduction protein [Glaciecola sp.]|jgi:EAL and modified HD-GYP domain-containing signal transduction protein